ncbi:MAG: hypothetical protein IIY21_03520 [Clostridiales bacterium]|nr:hypothetical protein [Clostridiales bacterium]MBQ1573762.1 hypothetical protein [Clostridiales bacterium]
MNAVLLKTTIEKSELRPEYFASKLDISLKTWRDKVDGSTDFKLSEAKKLAEILGLKDREVITIFFK